MNVKIVKKEKEVVVKKIEVTEEPVFELNIKELMLIRDFLNGILFDEYEIISKRVITDTSNFSGFKNSHDVKKAIVEFRKQTEKFNTRIKS